MPVTVLADVLTGQKYIALQIYEVTIGESDFVIVTARPTDAKTYPGWKQRRRQSFALLTK